MKIPKLKKKTIIWIAVIVIIAAVIFFRGRLRSSDSTVITGVKADRGDISLTVSGSGTVQPIEQYNIVAVASGEIMSDTIAVGDVVSKDDLLFVIDSEEAENNIRRSEIALERQRLSTQQSRDAVDNLIVTTNVSGYISALYVKEGDSIGANGKIADIVDTKNLKLSIPFNSNNAESIYVGESALVYMENSGEVINGTVSYIASGEYASGAGALVRDVEIKLENPGIVQNGAQATALIGGYACNSAGTVKFVNEVTIIAKSSGEVDRLYIHEGDYINSGATLVTLKNDSAVNSLQSSGLSIQDASLNLENTRKNLDNYNIKSPINGTIIDKKYKAGDVLDTNRTVLAVVADMSCLTFSMDIDETEIKRLEIGQTVDITADAIADRRFKGRIEEISIIGTALNGVTTYPVKVIIDDYEGLLPGMNVNAEIVVERVTNVVRVPVNAVQRGGVVLMKNEAAAGKQEGKAFMSQNIPNGYKYVSVVTGISDANFIEIKSGLSEGEEVFIVTNIGESIESPQNVFQQNMNGGGPTQMQGGEVRQMRVQNGGDAP